MLALALLAGCSTTAQTSTTAATAEDLAELLARVEALEAEQAHQAEALTECLDMVDDAQANAAAAQERSAATAEEVDLQAEDLAELVARVDVLWSAVESLQD